MNATSDHSEPVIEPKPGDQPDDPVSRALRQRIHQQELLAGLGVLALQGTSFLGLLDQTARMTAEGLGAEYCKVLEYIPSERRLSVRAGVGWGEGVVGTASVGADTGIPPVTRCIPASLSFPITSKMSSVSERRSCWSSTKSAAP